MTLKNLLVVKLIKFAASVVLGVVMLPFAMASCLLTDPFYNEFRANYVRCWKGTFAALVS